MHKLKIAIFRNPSFHRIRWNVTIHISNDVCHFPKKQSHRPNISGRHFFESLATKRIARKKMLWRSIKKSRLSGEYRLLVALISVLADRTSVSAAKIADAAKAVWVDLKSNLRFNLRQEEEMREAKLCVKKGKFSIINT